MKISEHHFGCASDRNKGTCTNRRGIRRDILEATVLDGLQHELMDDDLLEVFCEECAPHLNTLRMEASGNRAEDEARLQKVDRELDRLVDAIVQGMPGERVKDRMTALDAEKTALEARLEALPMQLPPLLHPRMGEVYREAVARLRETLASSPDRAEAVEHVRGLIDRIVLHPCDDKAPAS